MSMLSHQIEQLKDLRYRMGTSDKHSPTDWTLINGAIDTIESLSAKLSAANMGQSERYYGGGWIACEDRLPEDNREVLITAKSKINGDLDIAISQYADAVFGGQKLGFKEWYEPWRYFHNDYDVVAWCELLKPYQGE